MWNVAAETLTTFNRVCFSSRNCSFILTSSPTWASQTWRTKAKYYCFNDVLCTSAPLVCLTLRRHWRLRSRDVRQKIAGKIKALVCRTLKPLGVQNECAESGETAFDGYLTQTGWAGLIPTSSELTSRLIASDKRKLQRLRTRTHSYPLALMIKPPQRLRNPGEDGDLDRPPTPTNSNRTNAKQLKSDFKEAERLKWLSNDFNIWLVKFMCWLYILKS